MTLTTTRRAFFPVPFLATVAAMFSRPANVATAESSAPLVAAPRQRTPFVYGLPEENRAALDIAIAEATPLLARHGVFPPKYDCDVYYNALYRIGAPLGVEEARRKAVLSERAVFELGGMRADSAMGDMRYEYMLLTDAAYFLGLASGLKIATGEDARGSLLA